MNAPVDSDSAVMTRTTEFGGIGSGLRIGLRPPAMQLDSFSCVKQGTRMGTTPDFIQTRWSPRVSTTALTIASFASFTVGVTTVKNTHVHTLQSSDRRFVTDVRRGGRHCKDKGTVSLYVNMDHTTRTLSHTLVHTGTHFLCQPLVHLCIPLALMDSHTKLLHKWKASGRRLAQGPIAGAADVVLEEGAQD